MNNSLGALEFSSISAGVEIANEVVKKASVEILYLSTTCPGKLLLIVSGNEDEVKESISYGESLAGTSLVDSFVVNAISNAIIQGFKNIYSIHSERNAIAVMETSNVCSGIKSLDKVLKSSTVNLIKLKMAFGIGGKLVFIVSGNVSSLEHGFREALTVLESDDIASQSIIPSPNEEIIKHLI